MILVELFAGYTLILSDFIPPSDPILVIVFQLKFINVVSGFSHSDSKLYTRAWFAFALSV